jgi:hypothetical protein
MHEWSRLPGDMPSKTYREGKSVSEDTESLENIEDFMTNRALNIYGCNVFIDAFLKVNCYSDDILASK